MTTVRERYSSIINRGSKEVKSGYVKDKIKEIKGMKQAEVYRLTMMQGESTFIAFCFEDDIDYMIIDPIYRDVSESVFVPVFYTEKDLETHCMNLFIESNLFSNPRVVIKKLTN
ncbi:MAG: hypothetical protein SNJ33_06165 [Rikenellaceae bacterium]